MSVPRTPDPPNEARSIPLAPRRRWLAPGVREGVLFWERGRLAYNGVQLLFTAVMFFLRWPESRVLFTTNLGQYFEYAVIANLLYSMAYIAEAVFQIPLVRPFARPLRWFILINGTALACFFAFIGLLDVLRDPPND